MIIKGGMLKRNRLAIGGKITYIAMPEKINAPLHLLHLK
jgi:hypothetical protein